LLEEVALRELAPPRVLPRQEVGPQEAALHEAQEHRGVVGFHVAYARLVRVGAVVSPGRERRQVLDQTGQQPPRSDRREQHLPQLEGAERAGVQQKAVHEGGAAAGVAEHEHRSIDRLLTESGVEDLVERAGSGVERALRAQQPEGAEGSQPEAKRPANRAVEL
jgi:hypothetical protein